MNQFQDIIGHDNIKRYFNKAITENKIAHSYIFEGPFGVGKKMMAKAVAKVLLCENSKEAAACNTCDSCYKIDKGTHPDLIWIQRDTKVIKIDNIRENFIEQMSIKPYEGNYKIVVIPEAELITIEGQNAMLKVIEEPPSYGMIILVTENSQALLPTIRSRCVQISFYPLLTEQLKEKIKLSGTPQDKVEIYARFAQGSIGMLEKISQDDQFWEQRQLSIDYLNRIEKADVVQLYQIVDELVEKKEDLIDILNFWLLWYRDVAILKASEKTTENEILYNIDNTKQLLYTASKLTYNKINHILELIKQSILDIRRNIYPLFVIENLLLKMKERKR